MDQRIAIIDLGTNTCNLLIAEYEGFNYTIFHQGKEIVKLGKSGFEQNLLSLDGLERSVQSILKQMKIINGFGVTNIQVFSTSAVRDASNREWFQSQIEEKTGLKLNVISGEREAELIFEGVRLAFGNIDDNALILDIGGGSNEFILTNGGKINWKESFALGMARLIDVIPPSNPITPEEINRIRQYFDERLYSLWERLENTELSMLIGCSGAFDTIVDLIDQTEAGTKNRIRQEIALDDFRKIYEKLIRSSTSERIRMKGMEPVRVEMIVPAMIFIQLVLEKLAIKKLIQTDFALREGVLYEHIFKRD